RVPGVCAIALGGSRSRGLATKQSDYDIGLYYVAEEPLDVAGLRGIVAQFDDRGPEASVTPVGGWGPWINGGGWLTVRGTRVDLLYRDLVRVGEVIGDCRRGSIERHYQPGHPHAFVSTIYMGEVAYCHPLWDPAGRLAELKTLTLPYPQALRAAVIKAFLWEAEFAIKVARHGRALEDAVYVSGCAFRCIACLCQVLCAVNGAYLLNEKGAAAAVEAFPRRPNGFRPRVMEALGAIARDEPAGALDKLARLLLETEAIVGER
ncbi:MAG: nucleotidyltransferase domain-containing protein, partial [Hyphomicrobiaceae bacterium]|nr:nucleotidyltransferase domain-containing protein [Hyphomicrobiaceae bacterium]